MQWKISWQTLFQGNVKKISIQYIQLVNAITGITLNGEPAGRSGWRAVFPIQKHEFAAGWRAALKGGLDIRSGRRAAHLC